MLEDMNKIVPKMDEKDFDYIYNSITTKKEKKNIFSYKIVMAVVSCFLLILMIIPMRRMNNPSNPPEFSNETNKNQEKNNYNVLWNETSVIGIAAFNEFDNHNNESKKMKYLNSGGTTSNEISENIESSSEVIKESLKISYPYDYIKIISAYKFLINVVDIVDETAKNIIENHCGLGELEVVVADFETYIEEDGVYQLSVQDTLISLRGYNGYYTILVNSGAISIQIFSSHKKLMENEINKDFTPPVLSIFLKEEGDSRYVYFEASDNLLNYEHYDEKFAFKNIDSITSVSRNTIYSVLDLTNLPTKEVEANVLSINVEDNILQVQTDFHLEYIYLHEYTEGIKIEKIHVGDVIIVEYDSLFEKYDPMSVFANEITMKTMFEENSSIN